MLKVVLYARGRAPDLRGTQMKRARLAARLFHGLPQELTLPKPDAFAPLSAAFRTLMQFQNTSSPVVIPLDPITLPLLP
ncbi:hypothetical protein [Deinococcus ruber]|uniref:Uncharacterized protein n=1 Tax=Deinococcus ruber TaxID=1848197 RepID=A0A918CCI2_9DEIO|nr:hypothetical protein [Deinococcus ruber]GGR17279.1 hypothetical protein GCM10008957_32380 [Deinococcus ruber]